ncbi:acetyl-CoA carboxylase biotin carboxyl carrier protein subunit [Salirhabdus salicampi]|uniref:acetyl-CoA carboxylase biotin carboxyl carrier protein subunit n=1 Tax=Salirhabdus salicampi TaxID=476102 RepID=UPI0020C57ECC|nr:acetyl-CoA carboxylase biotin carboxyl carrier protein subunit [Salirhabdus salicampi]MCP8616387.1 acetyl-CoA carboxylase biotin carboxyl carrier protein subunit [Salirhabdus salicampi]
MKEIVANMAGSVWKVLVNEGEQVSATQDLVILESMKMEIPISAEANGVLKELKVQEGDFVDEGDVIAVLEYK